MDNNFKFNKYSRTGSIVAGIGALIMIIAFVLFIILNKKKETELTSITTELEKKDSINSVLTNRLISLKPPIEPIAYAVPTGRVSNPGVYHEARQLPQFQYFLCLAIADSLKNTIKKVDYYFNHPSFKQKRYSSTSVTDSFKVHYKGWGCLDTVNIFIERNNNKFDTINFPMCENLQLKGF